MMETKKNVFQELALSVWDFKSYGTLIRNRGVKVFGFSALLLGIYLLLSTVFMTIQVAEMVNVFRDEVLSEIPDFVLEDGTLTMDETFELDEHDLFIHINTEEYWSDEEIWDIFDNYSTDINGPHTGKLHQMRRPRIHIGSAVQKKRHALFRGNQSAKRRALHAF